MQKQAVVAVHHELDHRLAVLMRIVDRLNPAVHRVVLARLELAAYTQRHGMALGLIGVLGLEGVCYEQPAVVAVLTVLAQKVIRARAVLYADVDLTLVGKRLQYCVAAE